MGQYWYPVNLDKKEYIMPHKLGAGLKLWEQLANHPGTGAALIILCAAMPEERGGGDLSLDWHDDEELTEEAKKTCGVNYAAVARRTIGRWAGDRIALVGDYAEKGDLPPEFDADLIYDLCATTKERQEQVTYLKQRAEEVRQAGDPHGSATVLDNKADHLAKAKLYRDITDDVCQVIEHELGGKFEGDDWRHWKEG